MNLRNKLVGIIAGATLMSLAVFFFINNATMGEVEKLSVDETERLANADLTHLANAAVDLAEAANGAIAFQRETAVRNYLRSIADGLYRKIETIAAGKTREEVWPEVRRLVLAEKIAKTGYAYGMNSQGILTIHHKSEGKDVSGNTQEIRSRKNGFTTYHSVTAKRDKAIYFRYYEPFDLIIAPGAFIDELADLYDREGEARWMANLVETLQGIQIGNNGYIWALSAANEDRGNYIVSPGGSKNGQNALKVQDAKGNFVIKDLIDKAVQADGKLVGHTYSMKIEDRFHNMIAKMAYLPTLDWVIGVSVSKDDLFEGSHKITSSFGQAQNRMAWAGGILLVAVVGMGLFFAQKITGPIKRIVEMLQHLEEGKLDTRLRLVQKDEIGKMATAMDSFADNLQHEILTAFEKLAAGDFTFKAQGLIRAPLAKANKNLNQILGQIYTASEQIAAGGSQISDSSQALSQGATEQASSLEEITSSMTEMASQTKMNAENATQANQVSGKAKEAADMGNEQMKQMVGAMAEINQASQNISKIIKVIDEIAFQTNLLALNAAVEAARAGQHGKGFAVVAEEVRNLAARSAKAAQETAELIEGSVVKTGNGAQIADQTARALGEIVNSITKVTDLVAEIAAASNEQAQGISQVNQGLSQIDQVTQQNTANAEESAAAAEELSGQAGQLRQMLSRFKFETLDRTEANNTSEAMEKTVAVSASEWEKLSVWPESPSAMASENARKAIVLDDSEFGKY